MKHDSVFYAITKMGKFIMGTTFEHLQQKLAEQKESDIEMFVVFMYDTPYKTQFGNLYWWPQVQIIDIQKQPTTYQRGMFQVKYIYPDQGSYYFKGRKIILENCITHESVEEYIPANQSISDTTISNFYFSLRNILLKLNRESCDKLIEMQ